MPVVIITGPTGLTKNAKKELAEDAPQSEARPSQASPTVARYAALFNARDWDGVRAMLAEDVGLDVVSRRQRSGRGGIEKLLHHLREDSHLARCSLLAGWSRDPSRLPQGGGRPAAPSDLRERRRRPGKVHPRLYVHRIPPHLGALLGHR
jgi:hypothetical protein